MPLPKYFCWSKFGVEAGEQIESIIQRKDRERLINGGIFLWGIGNALGPSILDLLELVKIPEVIFSPIKSAPKNKDVSPDQVVEWTLGETIRGELYNLPSGSLVTSRMVGNGKKSHYALVCESQKKLRITLNGDFVESGQLRNIRSGRPIGYSQVTSIVAREEEIWTNNALKYPVAMRVKLVCPYFIKLLNPVPIYRENNGNGIGQILLDDTPKLSRRM